MYKLRPRLGKRLNRVHPLCQGLVGVWMFNELGGDMVRNLVSGENSTIGSSSFARDTRYGVNTSGTGYIVVPNPGIINNQPMTVTMGFVSDAFTNSDPHLFSIQNGSGLGRSVLYHESSGGTPLATFIAGSAINGSQTINLGQEYIVSFTSDGSSQIAFFIDGLLDSLTLDNASGAGDGDLVFFDAKSASGSSAFDGLGKFAYIHDRVLTDAEINQLHINPNSIFDFDISPALLFAEAVAAGNPWNYYAQLH